MNSSLSLGSRGDNISISLVNDRNMASGNVQVITSTENFREVLRTAGSKLVVIDFYADW